LSVNTEKASLLYRTKTLDYEGQRVLMTRIQGSGQEVDLSSPANCGGLGRVRHFYRAASEGWPANPLPIDPAARALNLGEGMPAIEAQVFQNAACNWRCWYCFVPFNLLSADMRHSEWSSIEKLLSQYAAIPNRPLVLDLSGGHPELTPELVLWSMRSLRSLGLDQTTFLWSDDNLSTDFFFTKLTQSERDEITAYRNYAKVGCFKGFDSESFAFNTMAEPEHYQIQFDLMRRLIDAGLDMYAYATFTCARRENLRARMRCFVDQLQEVHPNLPLRTVPLEVQVFTPTKGRIRPGHLIALEAQREAMEEWRGQLEERFSQDQRNRSICDVSLVSRAEQNA
jgi:uncharacterized Fe-S cluster-containing radical SAM superfamily protein